MGAGAGPGRPGAVLQDALINTAQHVKILKFEAFIGRMLVAR
jgi:hypothetical protein